MSDNWIMGSVVFPSCTSSHFHVMPGHSVIGTCSICRGPVSVPTLWGGIHPPTPKCGNCGATKKANHGPVIDMVPHT